MKRLVLCLLACVLFLGAMPAMATVLTYRALAEGWKEAEPNESRAFASSVLVLDDVAHTMYLGISWAGFTTATTAAHIHCCTTEPFTGTAIPATMLPSLPGFPLDARFDGFYEETFDLLDPATYNPEFIAASGGSAAAAEAAFLAGVASGRSYLNIHTQLFPAGEVRDFFRPPPQGGTVPEPDSIALLGLGALGLALLQWRRAPTRTPIR